MFTLYLPFNAAKDFYIETHQSYAKYVDIIPVIKYAVMTQNGYDEKTAQHMSKKIFRQLNKKTQYPNMDHFDIMKLTELYQKQDENDSRIIYIDTRSAVYLKDKNNTRITGEESYQQFTVLIENNSWYIIDYAEPITPDWRK